MENVNSSIVLELQKQHHTLKQILSYLMALAGNTPPDCPAEHTEPPRKQKLYNRKEAADYLLVDPRTVTRYRVKGKLSFIHDENNRIRYPEDALKACYHWKWGHWPSE